ncbi:MAG: recombinase family protein [Rhizobiaceae bacterium]|nr:MAG: recombinase family protein [Rhizobiaceae bacterium]
MQGRPELKRLLRDVLDDDKPFRAILVLDVSRWGRFQDADQAAHYEYMCREAGAPVFYCAEAFDNEGGAMATLIKQMKRVMAAEYSRELSTKVSRAQRQQARLGYKQGGPAILGTRRLAVDEHGRPRMFLEPGQQKGVSSDRVMFVHGLARDVKFVRLIFELYVSADLTLSEVAAELNRRRRKWPDGTLWNRARVRAILTKEILTGTYIFGRSRNNLGRKQSLPESEHIRVAVMDPIISPELFQAARKKREDRKRVHYTNEELLAGLKRLWAQEGIITTRNVRDCPYVSVPEVFARRFGSLRKACRAIGYTPPYKTLRDGWCRSFTDEDLINELRRMRDLHGYLTQGIIDADPHSPSAMYFRSRLGSLPEAYKMVGVSPRPFSNRIYKGPDGGPPSDEWLLGQLSKLLIRHGYLSRKLINEEPSCPSTWVYCQRFGDLLTPYALVGYNATAGEMVSQAWSRSRVRRRRKAGDKEGVRSPKG